MKGRGKAVIKLISMLIIVSAIPCMLLNYVIDPLQFYRRSYYFNNILYPYQRFQNPGLARTYNYDSIILGTSMTENFLPSDVKKILGFDVLKLSISAGSAYEQRRIFEVAEDTGKVKNVIWGIDLSSFRGEVTRKGSNEDEFPEYMYDSDFFNDYMYLLNDKTTEYSINTLIRYICSGPAKKYINVERYSFWYPYADFGEAEMKARGEVFERNNEGMGRDYDIKEIIASAEANLIAVIEKNPEIDFYLYYTPASVMRELYFIKEGIYEIQTEFKQYLNEKLLKHDNVKLFDFQAAEEIVLDLSRYSDYSHYDLATIRYVLECMNENRYLVTREDQLLEQAVEIVKSYKYK